MRKWLSILILLLAASVSLNLYLLIISKDSLPYLSGNPNIPSISTTKGDYDIDTVYNQSTSQVNSPGPNGQQKQDQTSRAEKLKLAERWLLQKNYGDLTHLLQSYLKQHPQDMAFLLIEARLKVETSLLSDAIAHYYSLLRHPMTAAQQIEIERQIQQLTDNTINQLKSTYSWDVLARFVEPLLQIDPENRLYILSLARAYAEQFQELLMENILASLPFDDPAAMSIRQIILAQNSPSKFQQSDENNEQNTPAELGQNIKLLQYGDQYVVNANLSGNPIDLLIDTGASITAISKQYFNNLSHRYKRNYVGQFSVNTANGTITASMYEFTNLTIEHITVEQISVVVLPMSNLQHADGLLGMNFLREFDFKIDQTQAILQIDIKAQ